MIRALMTAASGMKAQQKQVDNIANNIANVNTAGFKRSDLNFRSLFYQTYENPGAATGANHMRPTGLQLGSGVEISGSHKDFRQGELVASGQPLALAPLDLLHLGLERGLEAGVHVRHHDDWV